MKDLLTLIEAINADSESERTLAINTLDRIGFDIMVALPNLIEVLKDDDILSNTEAAYTLGNRGKPAIPILIEVIRNNRGRVRRSAACALGYIGPNAKAAVPALVEALMDEDLLSSMQITYTLAKIKHGAGAALPTLIAKLEDMRNDLCRSAASKRLLEDQIDIVLSVLSPREQRVLRLRLGLEDGRIWTLQEVAKELGITRERVRQIEGKALCKWQLHKDN